MRVRLTKAVIVIAVIAVVAACSLKTLYNRLDYLIPEYIEGTKNTGAAQLAPQYTVKTVCRLVERNTA